MANYLETLQPLIHANILTESEIYNYENDYLQQVFQRFFDFCSENLELNQADYHITPSHFYYANNYEINATAYQKDGRKLIAVNMGAIDKLWSFYEGKNAFFESPENEHYQGIAEHKHISATELLFQYTTLFFYYHEFGHLIQHNNDPNNFSLKENLIANESAENSLQKHIFEFDADWFAAGQLAFVLVEFYKDHDGHLYTTRENLSDLISLGLAAIFIYFVLTSDQFPQIYYQGRSHPHPYVRISYVLTFVMDTFQPNLPEGIDLNLQAILANAVLLSEHLLATNFGNPAMTFAGVFLEESESIEAYINAVIEASENYPELSRNKL